LLMLNVFFETMIECFVFLFFCARYDNARLLQLADAARSRIEELEHRLRVSEGQVKSVTDQIKQMERMLTAERSERARVESTHHTTTTTTSSSSSDDDLRRLTVLLEEEKAKTYVKSFLYMLVVPLVV
jgi:septal ring factor EnvC (AmiA/AmiB activator)